MVSQELLVSWRVFAESAVLRRPSVPSIAGNYFPGRLEQAAQDMIAVRISPDIRMAVVASILFRALPCSCASAGAKTSTSVLFYDDQALGSLDRLNWNADGRRVVNAKMRCDLANRANDCKKPRHELASLTPSDVYRVIRTKWEQFIWKNGCLVDPMPESRDALKLELFSTIMGRIWHR
jgi:hypothetical protein